MTLGPTFDKKKYICQLLGLRESSDHTRTRLDASSDRTYLRKNAKNKPIPNIVRIPDVIKSESETHFKYRIKLNEVQKYRTELDGISSIHWEQRGDLRQK